VVETQKYRYQRQQAEKVVSIHGFTQQKFVDALSGTDLYTNRTDARNAWNESKLRLRNNIKLQRSKTIDYDNLNESRTNIVSKYSIQVGIQYHDEAGNYEINNDGSRRTSFITVRTNKKLSRKQILNKAKNSSTDVKTNYGRMTRRYRQRDFMIQSGLRRK
jgi:hypothetical protein